MPALAHHTPVSYPKPDLSRYEVRKIVVPKARVQLEHALLPWITEVVNRLGYPKSNVRATPKWLVNSSRGRDDVFDAPPGFADPRGNVQTIRATFDLANMAHGNWFVVGIKFTPALSAAQQKISDDSKDAKQREFRNQLEEKAKAENRMSPKALAFKTDLHLDTWTADIKAGAGVIQQEINVAYGFAKKAASIPDNPYSVKDIALDQLDAAVEGLGAMEERAEKLVEVYKKVREFQDKAEEGKELSEKWKEAHEKEDVLKESQRSVFHESTGDIIAKKAIDVAANIPGAGRFVKGFAGMFFDFASANYAGLVATIRGRAFSWYIAGFIQGVTRVAIERPTNDPLDRFFFNVANKRASSMQEPQSFQAQVFLLWYTSTHQITGENSPGETRSHPDDWTFPDGYLAAWMPERLGWAMATLMKTYDYLVS